MSERERRRLRRALGALGWSGSRVIIADGFCRRLLGMTVRAPIDKVGVPIVMAFPNCKAVHTFGMSYPLDIAFIDDGGAVLELHRGVGPFRMLGHRGAVLVLERAAGEALEGRSSGRVARLHPVVPSVSVRVSHPRPLVPFCPGSVPARPRFTFRPLAPCFAARTTSLKKVLALRLDFAILD